MIKRASAILRIKFSSIHKAEIIRGALEPETMSGSKYRSKVKVFRKGENLLFLFNAKDTTALRASVNSYLNWLISLINIYNFLESQK